jgi:apolipoprotein N-acyltransferase
VPVFVLSFPLQAIAAALLGAAHALAFAPWNQGWLQVLALAALFTAADSARGARQAALAGFAFGLGWFGVGVSWVYISMHVYGGLWAWLAGLATLAFVALLALFPALALWAAIRFGPPSPLRPLLALPAAWAATEWLRGVVFTGFPWLASGYAHTDTPLAGFAPIAGVYGLTLLAALAAGVLVALLRGCEDFVASGPRLRRGADLYRAVQRAPEAQDRPAQQKDSQPLRRLGDDRGGQAWLTGASRAAA